MATCESERQPFVFDAAAAKKNSIPDKLVWSKEHRPTPDAYEELLVPMIDLGGFFSSDVDTASMIAKQVHEACEKYGCFMVTNHGVDAKLLAEVERFTDDFFSMPLVDKERAKKRQGEKSGYCNSFTERFATNLPWKELLCLTPNTALDYMVGTLGQDFHRYGMVMQEYCQAMSHLCLEILEVLGLDLGVGRNTFRDMYVDNESLLCINHYPSCPNPDLTLGLGPHFDPNTLTVLYQSDNIAGLQVCTEGKWYTVSPKPNTFVINIGDTFMALTNRRYKSCFHRAVVNSEETRKSLSFFLSPKMELLVQPPKTLVDSEHPRIYPDFTWQTLFEFTQSGVKLDNGMDTINAFIEWLQKNKENDQQ